MKYDIVVYTKVGCKYCVELKEFMAFVKIPYKEVKIPDEISVEEVKKIAPTAKTVPVVILDGVYFGGWSELKKKLNDDGIGL